MPALDFANPLHTFDNPSPAQTGHGLTFTASKDCYIYGALTYTAGGSPNILTIDNTPVATAKTYNLGGSTSGAVGVNEYFIQQTLIKSGSVIKVIEPSADLHIFDVAS